MNLCSFTRQDGYIKRISHKQVDKHLQLKQILSHLYLPSAKLDFDSHDTSNGWLSVGLTSVQGWRTRQEDAHLCDLRFDNQDHLALIGVFDGHNGFEISQYAAKVLPEYIKRSEHFTKQQYVKSLEQAFLEFDQSLLQEKCNQHLSNIRVAYELNSTGNCHYGQARRRKDSPTVALNTGTTAVVALLTKAGHAYVANIGDSRCVLCTKGKAYPLSKDHKPTDLTERHRIERAGCFVINGRINQGLNLSRAFGDHILKSNHGLPAEEQAVSAFPEVISKEKIRAGDFVVLACDGVWNCMSNKQVCALVSKHLKRGMVLSQICEQVVRRCVSPVRPLNGQIGGDNMTCIIVRFDRELH